MFLPYQCLEKARGSLLVAARGSTIDLFRTDDSTQVFSWTCPATQTTGNKPASKEEKKDDSTSQPARGDGVPPPKKQKLSPAMDGNPAPVPKDGKKKKNNRAQDVSSGLEAPAVTALAITNSGQHVIAVTGEDKSIRVFKLVSENGSEKLQQISIRAMPKRPCALAITKDGSTIVSADKFGDLYSLPLICTEAVEKATVSSETPEPAPEKSFVPAANEKTIHSQRNRKALENQKRNMNQKSEKSEPTFESKLLLGHVSMLTDIKLASVGGHDYIISADRDEHIRISRGIPQTHIIEGFCLGHSDFVSRICVPKTRPEILVSGGGEDDLFVWDWRAGQVLSRTNLASHVAELGVAIVEDSALATTPKIAVSGLWHVHLASLVTDLFIVTCEGIPTLFSFLLTSKNGLKYVETVKLPGNVLDVVTDIPTQIGDQEGIIVSIDTVRQSGSKTQGRGTVEETVPPLHSFVFSGTSLISREGFSYRSKSDAKQSGLVSEVTNGRLTNLLYNIENLRKRGEEDGQEE